MGDNRHAIGRQDFETLMLPYLDAAFNVARWLVRNDSDASDIVQESYLRAFRSFARYQGGDPRCWVLAIVRNASRTWLRRERGVRATLTLDEHACETRSNDQTPEQQLICKIRQDTVRACIESLSPEYREVLILRELEELSYKEIAEVVGVPIGTVMSRLSRARRQLQFRLGSNGPTVTDRDLRVAV